MFVRGAGGHKTWKGTGNSKNTFHSATIRDEARPRRGRSRGCPKQVRPVRNIAETSFEAPENISCSCPGIEPGRGGAGGATHSGLPVPHASLLESQC